MNGNKNMMYQHLQNTSIVVLRGILIAIYACIRKGGRSKINGPKRVEETKKAKKTQRKQNEGNYKNNSAEAGQVRTEKKEN